MVNPLKTVILWRQFVVWLRNFLIQLSKKKVDWNDVLNGLLRLVRRSETLIPPVNPQKIPEYDLSGGYVPKLEPRKRLFRRFFERIRRQKNG